MASTYTVVRGDTLSEIAVTYNTTVAELVRLNNIKDPDYIVVGQVLKLSGSPPAVNKNISTKAVIKHFGEQSDSAGVIYATWTWDKDHTKEYQVKWYYDTGDGVWFIGNDSTVTDKQSTYTAPANAKRIKFIVKPISGTHKVNDKDTTYWTAQWSTNKIHNIEKPPAKPSNLTVTLGTSDLKLTASVTNVDPEASLVQFEVVKDDVETTKTGKSKVSTQAASYSCTVVAGGRYKVRCRAIAGNLYSEWSDYSQNYETIPAKVKELTQCKAKSETSIYVEWGAITNATKYDIQHARDKKLFDGSSEVTIINDVETTHFEITGLESGQEYFFRVRAKNDQGESGWSDIASCTIGGIPAAPTTWSSTTTVVVGEPLKLYWVHNARDNSSQTFAELEIDINGVVEKPVVRNTNTDENKDKTLEYVIDTSIYVDGVTIKWRARTAGVTEVPGDWSIQRTVEIYAPPTLEFTMNSNTEDTYTLTAFPITISALAGPETQAPVGYHLTITANESYETVDDIGNTKLISSGDEIYSRHFDISEKLETILSAGDVNLDNNKSYTISCLVSMNSGLTTSESIDFTVEWADAMYEINAELFIDEDNYVVHINPYVGEYKPIYHKVNKYSEIYRKTDDILENMTGSILIKDSGERVYTQTGDEVYHGTNSEGVEFYYCIEDSMEYAENILLSVYRREFDGGFTELAKGIDNAARTFITDPHPSLDYARYRIVAIDQTTGAVSYYDMPSYPINCDSVIIQWDEKWSNFDAAENEEEQEEPVLAGSMLKLPYNVDISDDHEPDVSLVKYIGRSHPVSYYGTQKGVKSTWSMDIEKDDIETLHALRRLSVWSGDVYVREPSGSGYWAAIAVSFSQTHNELTIPVTINVVRVEGGA